MFYNAGTGHHGLPHDPLKALVAPRPIGWVSSLDANGVANLAPYSFFNLVSTGPAIVAFSSGGRKDSQTNIEQTREFVCNIAGVELANAVNATSAPVDPGIDEFEIAGIEKADSVIIKPPRVAAARAHLECRYLTTLTLDDLDGNTLGWGVIFGQVVGVHIDDALIKDGLVDTGELSPLSRLGYLDYGILGEIFALPRPSK